MANPLNPPIPTTHITFLGPRQVFRFHRGLTQEFDITILSENKKVELLVKVLPTAEIEFTIQNSEVTVVPFTSRLLWLNMAYRQGHQWSTWLDRRCREHDYEAFVFTATGGSVPPAFCYNKAKTMELEPIISVNGLNNDMGCFVCGATMWLDAELDPEGPHNDLQLSGVNEFNIHWWAPE